jgi:replicative DNA helicase
MWKLRKGILSSSELKAVAEASERLTGLPICFSFCSRDAKEISPTITEMVEVHSCALVILDYLQLAKASASKERREREIAEISWTLKTAALTHNIPILCLSQLNRESERQNRKPILADLRESGAIEQDADVVMFLSREEADNGSSGPVEILIAKGRNIGTGSVTVYFDAERMTFRDLQRREDVHD